MKGSCKSLVELEYLFEKVYKVTTDQLDWNNPEGQQYPHDLRKPLPLIPNSRGRRVIPFDHFINNDLEYLSGVVSSRKYATSVTKTKTADYGHIKWIEDLVPNRMWSQVPITVRRDDDKLYKFKEGDFNRLHIQDVEDMLLLLVQGKLTNLTVEERLTFNVSLRMFTRSVVIQRRVEDLQLGNQDKKNILMRIDELHKFSDGTLNDVRTALNDRLKGIQMKYLPQTIWRQSDRDKAGAMIQAIDKQLKTRRIMQSLEKFVDKMDSMHSTLSMYYDYDAHVKGELLVMMKNSQSVNLLIFISNTLIELFNDFGFDCDGIPKRPTMYLNLWSYKVVRHRYSNPMIQPEPEGSTQGYPLVSVEVLRKVTLQKALSENEKKVAEFIWRACNDGSDIVFKSKDLQLRLGIFKSLFLNVEVAAGILDMWSLVLNHEEKYREKNSGGGNIYIIVNYLIRRRSIFESNITAVLSQSPYESFHDVDLVFFPMITTKRSHHFYLICFNMKTAEIDIIDNLDNDVDNISVRYGELPIYLIHPFLDYLGRINHPKFP
ncbi:hypothetical protein Tco_1273989 [Tanacetum coccineum]